MYLLELAGEDDRFAIAEAAVAATRPRRLAPGVASAAGVDLERARHLARTHAVLESAARAAGGVEAVRAAAVAMPLERTGTIAVRCRDVRGTAGVDTTAVEHAVGAVLVDRGLDVDLEAPAHVLRVLAAGRDGDTRWYLGWVVLEPERGFGTRRPPRRPFQQPGTMGPQLARTLVNLSGVGPDECFLDPMCGPGALVLEAGLLGARPLGVDYQARMVRGARRNYAALGPTKPPIQVLRASAHALPVSAADAAAFDAPYGRQSPIGHASARELVDATLAELAAVVPRCVAVFDRPLAAIAQRSGWRVLETFERPVHRSLTRHVAVLERPG
ncbi:MAG: methyltransferase domain-containing protein [Halobacteriales archaeon]